MKKIIFLLFFLSITVPLFSQWTSNANLNTAVCDTNGEQVLPKIAKTSDGGCYISWFDNRGGTYAVYIQKLDINGNKLFQSNGLLVSNNPQGSSLVDYDLTVDDGNNAIVVFTDTRNGSSINPFAYKISPAGTMLWGANGITLTDSSNIYQANPKVVATSDGNYVFAWIYATSPRKIAMQKLNSAGAPQWGASPVKLSGSGSENLDWPALIKSDSGSVIMLWSGYTGTFISPQNYRLYTQKFSPVNSKLWTLPQDTVYNLGRVSGFYTPRLFSDGENGALYCWRDDRDLNNLQSSFVQRFTNSGVRKFPVNGSECSNDNTSQHFDPIATYVPQTGETYAFWAMTNSGQTQVGRLNGQKFNSSGVQQWTLTGKMFKPLDNNQFSSLNVLSKDTNVIVSFNESQTGSNNNLIKALKTGPSGEFHWVGNIIIPSAILSEKLRLGALLNQSTGMSILVWSDKRNDAGNIYAQNINLDGTFGLLVGIGNPGNELPGNFNLNQNYPNPFNPSTKINFAIPKQAMVTLKVFDILGREVAVLVNDVKQPGYYTLDFDASHLASGVYFYKLTSGTFTEVKRIVLVK